MGVGRSCHLHLPILCLVITLEIHVGVKMIGRKIENKVGKEQWKGTKGKRDGRIEDRREKDRVVERWIEG